MATGSDTIKISDRPQFPQLPDSEVDRIAKKHAGNGFSIKATASQLGMTYISCCRLIYRHSNLMASICRYKKALGCFRPYGPKKGEL